MAQYYYETYGLVVRSDFEFPELVPTSRRDVDITINKASVSAACQDKDFAWQTQEIKPDIQTFVWKALGTFQIRNGDTIDIDPREEAEIQQLSLPLFGTVFATLLHMRGLLVLHASAVARDGRAVIFLGDKGAGKSTTAFAMIKAGYNLLSDDVVAIYFDEQGQPKVLPAFNQVKLLDDAAKSFGLNLEDAAQIHPMIEKRRHIAKDAFCSDAADLAAVYVLARDKTKGLSAFSPDEALKALIAFSYASRYGSEAFPPAIAIGHMQACARLISAADIGKLTAPSSLTQLSEAVAMVDQAIFPPPDARVAQ